MKVTQTYSINGMACAMCAKAVSEALTTTPGVESAEVSLAEKHASITYDDSIITPEQMQAVVKSAGYEMSL